MKTTVILGVMDEVFSLKESVDVLNGLNTDVEILLVYSPYSTERARAMGLGLTATYENVRMQTQVTPGIGGAYQDGFNWATTEFVLMMSSDLETDPNLVPRMIAELKAHPDIDIVAVSRWLQKSSFVGYSRILLIANFIFQSIIRIVFKTKMTDSTYAFRIYRRESLENVVFREKKHGFFLESLLLPLVQGSKVLEIPGVWKNRTEGVRHISLSDYQTYIKVIFGAVKLKNAISK